MFCYMNSSKKLENFVTLYSIIDTYAATYIATLLYYTVNNIRSYSYTHDYVNL